MSKQITPTRTRSGRHTKSLFRRLVEVVEIVVIAAITVFLARWLDPILDAAWVATPFAWFALCTVLALATIFVVLGVSRLLTGGRR